MIYSLKSTICSINPLTPPLSNSRLNLSFQLHLHSDRCSLHYYNCLINRHFRPCYHYVRLNPLFACSARLRRYAFDHPWQLLKLHYITLTYVSFQNALNILTIRTLVFPKAQTLQYGQQSWSVQMAENTQIT